MAKDTSKTNALRLLDAKGIKYELKEYGEKETFLTGNEVAALIGAEEARVFKTLITHSGNNYYVCVIPVNAELNLKSAARHFGEKKLEMLAVKDILPVTGYIKGGCSPVGMKKLYRTAIDSSAENFDRIYCSAGRRGLQMEIDPMELASLVRGELADLV